MERNVYIQVANEYTGSAANPLREPCRTVTIPIMQFILAIGFILFAVSFDVPFPDWLPVLPALFGE